MCLLNIPFQTYAPLSLLNVLSPPSSLSLCSISFSVFNIFVVSGLGETFLDLKSISESHWRHTEFFFRHGFDLHHKQTLRCESMSIVNGNQAILVLFVKLTQARSTGLKFDIFGIEWMYMNVMMVICVISGRSTVIAQTSTLAVLWLPLALIQGSKSALLVIYSFWYF